jgi:hypothetical protein
VRQLGAKGATPVVPRPDLNITNVVIFTDDILKAQRGVELAFVNNSIHPAIRSVSPKGAEPIRTRVDRAAEGVGRSRNGGRRRGRMGRGGPRYSVRRPNARQVLLYAYVTEEQEAKVLDEVNAVQSRQVVSQSTLIDRRVHGGLPPGHVGARGVPTPAASAAHPRTGFALERRWTDAAKKATDVEPTTSAKAAKARQAGQRMALPQKQVAETPTQRSTARLQHLQKKLAPPRKARAHKEPTGRAASRQKAVRGDGPESPAAEFDASVDDKKDRKNEKAKKNKLTVAEEAGRGAASRRASEKGVRRSRISRPKTKAKAKAKAKAQPKRDTQSALGSVTAPGSQPARRGSTAQQMDAVSLDQTAAMSRKYRKSQRRVGTGQHETSSTQVAPSTQATSRRAVANVRQLVVTLNFRKQAGVPRAAKPIPASRPRPTSKPSVPASQRAEAPKKTKKAEETKKAEAKSDQ